MRQFYLFALFLLGIFFVGYFLPQQAVAYIPPEPGQVTCSALTNGSGSCQPSCSYPDTANIYGYCTNWRYTCCIKYVPPNPCSFDAGARNQAGCKCTGTTGCTTGLECSEIARVTTNSSYVPNSYARCIQYAGGVCTIFQAFTTTDYSSPYTINNYEFRTSNLGQSYQKTFMGQSTVSSLLNSGICASPGSSGGGGGGGGGGWGNCSVGGVNGVCQDVQTQSCGGYYDSGNYCPGPWNIQCCLPVPRYTISGQVFIDTNRNAIRDNGEGIYWGATIRLSGDASGTTTTDSSGNYSFGNLLAGTYTITITIPQGFVNVDDVQYPNLVVNATSLKTGYNFAIVNIYSISGNVFNDLNKNRLKDSNDGVLEPNITSGIAITKDTTNGNLNVDSTTGTYTITGLYAGTYNISYTSAIPAGYFLIYPLNGPPPRLRFTVGPDCNRDIGFSFGATCAGGNVANGNFAISNSIPWLQTYGLNLRIDEGFEDKIPNSPLYPAFASVADDVNGGNLASQTVTAGSNCTSTGQLCTPIYTTSITTQSVLTVNYTVPGGCSSIRIHMYVDGVKKTTSGWLGWPGATSPYNALPLSTGALNIGPVTAGTHTLGLQAEGQLGGCNTIGLGGWSGSATITTSN